MRRKTMNSYGGSYSECEYIKDFIRTFIKQNYEARVRLEKLLDCTPI